MKICNLYTTNIIESKTINNFRINLLFFIYIIAKESIDFILNGVLIKKELHIRHVLFFIGYLQLIYGLLNSFIKRASSLLMSPVKMDSKSNSVMHSPAIMEYSEQHTKDPQNLTISSSFTKAIFSLIIACLIFAFGYNIGAITLISTGSNTCNLAIYYSLLFIWILSFQNVLYHSLKLFGVVYKLSYPGVIFVPSMLKSFAKSLSFVIAWSSSSYSLSYETFLECKNSQNKAFYFFDSFIMNASRGPLNEKQKDSIISEVMSSSMHNSAVFNMIIPFFMKVYTIFIARDFITFVLNYLIHYKYYEKRIIENTDKIAVLRAMNSVLSSGYTTDVEDTASQIFQTLCGGEIKPIKLADLRKFFNEATAHKIFELCNGNENNELSQDDIYSFYVSALTEQKHLEKSICSNSSTVQSFKNILNIGAFILCSVIVLNYIPIFESEKIESLKGPAFFLAAVFSVNYSFVDSFKGFFSSLYFIFFVRPYEIGDLISVFDRIYEVHDITLVSTILYDGCSYLIFPNMKLATEPIKNMRLNKTMEEIFIYKFSFKNFEATHEIFLKRLISALKNKSSEYRKASYFKKVTLISEDTVEVALTVQINTSAVDINKIRERKNALVFKLNSIFEETGLLPFQH